MVRPLLQGRFISLNPSLTVDCQSFPSGFIPLDGSERIESIYSLVKAGHFVAPLEKIETVHKAFIGVRELCKAEFPILCGEDVTSSLLAQNELLKRILIKRDFWTLSDFNDAELNKSYGLQNAFFDNYKWSQVLWKRFQQYVENFFPISEHTHLYYYEYEDLIRSFGIFEKGVKSSSLLPKSFFLHPPYGIPTLMKVAEEPLLLLKCWLRNFRSLLMLNRALVVGCGCGVSAFSVRNAGVSMVCGVDSRPRAIQACRSDSQRIKKFSNMKFHVAELFPSKEKKYDLIVFYPDGELISAFSDNKSDAFTFSQTGYNGLVEQFFDEVEDYLSDSGVIAFCSSNLQSIITPFAPHPVEYEVKVNRRFVILDYFDSPMKNTVQAHYNSSKIVLPLDAQRKMRSELWVLHKLSAIDQFAYLHGIPGAAAPSMSCRRRLSQINLFRHKSLKFSIENRGENWGDYKRRLISLLQERSDVEEDDVAEAMRMSLDPTYPEELAVKAKQRVENKLKKEEDFNKSVSSFFRCLSPREVFDKRIK